MYLQPRACTPSQLEPHLLSICGQKSGRDEHMWSFESMMSYRIRWESGFWTCHKSENHTIKYQWPWIIWMTWEDHHPWGVHKNWLGLLEASLRLGLRWTKIHHGCLSLSYWVVSTEHLSLSIWASESPSLSIWVSDSEHLSLQVWATLSSRLRGLRVLFNFGSLICALHLTFYFFWNPCQTLWTGAVP